MIIPLNFTTYSKAEILTVKDIIKTNYKATYDDTIYGTIFVALTSYINKYQYSIVSKKEFMTGLLNMLEKLAVDDELIATPDHCIVIYTMLISLLDKKYNTYTYKQLLELFDTSIPYKECRIHNYYLRKYCDTNSVEDFICSQQFGIWLSVFEYFYRNFKPGYILI